MIQICEGITPGGSETAEIGPNPLYIQKRAKKGKKGQKSAKKPYLPLEDELLEDSDSSTLAATVAAACDNVVLFELFGM